MRLLTYRATEQDVGKRVESILLGHLQISRGLLSRLKRRERGITINGQKAYSTYVLQAGDVVTADVGDGEPPRHLAPVPAFIPSPHSPVELHDFRNLFVGKHHPCTSLSSTSVTLSPMKSAYRAF